MQIDLINGDSFNEMPLIPDESFHLIFVDPPYKLSNDGFSCQSGKRVSVNKGVWDKSSGFKEDFDFHLRWIHECKRLLKPNGTIFISGTYHSIYHCGYALLLNGWHILNDISWFKPNASPNLSGRMFTASHESLIWAKKSKTAKQSFNYKLMREMDFSNDKLKAKGKQMRSVWCQYQLLRKAKRNLVNIPHKSPLIF